VTKIDEVVISTVFLGLDYRMSRRGPPLLFETKVFGGSLEHFQNRCATWDKAAATPAEAVTLVRGEQAVHRAAVADVLRRFHDLFEFDNWLFHNEHSYLAGRIDP
jgi:hypothetical protein